LSRDKTALQSAFAVAGIPVPEWTMVEDADAAMHAAEELGGPVIVKPSDGTASRDVCECATPLEAAQAFSRVERENRRDPWSRGSSVLLQRKIEGRMIGRTAVAHNGVELAGFARERLEAVRLHGSSSLVRYVHAPDLAELTRRAAGTLGINGFFAIEFCRERVTGKAYAIDLSRRMVPPTHTGHLVGVDLCAALASALRGEAVSAWELPPDVATILALFPQEFWRDPQSSSLSRYATDAPWDEPQLLRAMLEMRYEQ
jgi:biotin carboxylase